MRGLIAHAVRSILPERFLKIRYFDISWLSRLDGPGHRVVLFLQGCNLCCPWCHSPHSQAAESPILFFASRCLNCGRCEQICLHGVHEISETGHVLHRERCVRCGKCIDACPVSNRKRMSGALALPTRDVAVSDLWTLLYPQLDLVRDIGGLTVSGGEALLQSQALRGLLRLCREHGIHTALETSGALPRRHFTDVAGLVDCWLFGLRPTPAYSPVGADRIADNLRFLGGTGSRVIVRMPVVAGVTDHVESLERVAATMHASGAHEIQLLPFHGGTPHYYDALGSSCSIGDTSIPDAKHLGEIRDFFQRGGLHASVLQ